MISLMEPVIQFLNEVAQETRHREITGEEGPLLRALEGDERDLFEIVSSFAASRKKSVTTTFKRPPRRAMHTPVPNEQSIQFSRPKDEIATLKKFFEVGSGKAAGEAAWDFVFDVEDL